MLGVNRQVKFTHSIVNNVLKLRALISLDQIGGYKAYKSISATICIKMQMVFQKPGMKLM